MLCVFVCFCLSLTNNISDNPHSIKFNGGGDGFKDATFQEVL